MARYLVVADRTLTSPDLLDRVAELAAEDPEPTYVTLLIPARYVSYHHGVAQESEAVARRQAEEAAEVYVDAGVGVTWMVIGDVSPPLAIEDELAAMPGEYEAIVISTLPPGLSRWLRLDVPVEAERRFDIPVIHVIAERRP